MGLRLVGKTELMWMGKYLEQDFILLNNLRPHACDGQWIFNIMVM